MQVEGKVALVTGGAEGLGRAFTEALLEAGAKVCFCDVNTEQGESTYTVLKSKYGSDRVIFQKCDVSNQTEMEGKSLNYLFRCTKETFGNIDIVCNNAGIGGEKPPLWGKVVDVNVKGCICGTLLALDYLSTEKGGSGGVIVNISSAGALNINPYGPVYLATKSAILSLSRSFAQNPLACSGGVRVNVLCPSFAETSLVRNISEQNTYDVNVARKFVEHTPSMSPKDVAEAFMELVVDESKNGAVLKCSKEKGKQYCTINVTYS
ncbi:hypothetical protein FSP39_022202 [Pinctada imbricata]|uniref:15-hydroxyprostaglandin dehydrogenase [NAD(+)] n=1 Tax=Pinctada imbricata TaxID=66713 RepID=A0AA88XQ85_PINIB|nr:hypothetical protein FSP39_022202 [Pinctada imbricata]